MTLGNALGYATDEKKLLPTNPLGELKTKKRHYDLKVVDPASVVNPMQARMLIDAVNQAGKPGPPLKAFFATMYHAGLRPEEAADLSKSNLARPENGWGDLNLSGARPEIGGEWTDSGKTKFGTAPDGRLFRGARDGGRVGSSVYGRVWADARDAVLSEQVAAGPLARPPYDLRHACVSAWLSGGVQPPSVAKWAGLAVLLNVYAKCLDGGEHAAREGVARAFDVW